MPEFDRTDLGQGEVGEVLTGAFPLRNRGSAPLLFELQATCTCTELWPMKGEIDPGQIQDVHVGIKLRYRGKDETVAIRIETNDPRTSPAAHYVLARNVAPFTVSPALVDFGTVVDDGKVRTASLRILGPGGKPLPSDVSVTAASGDACVSVEPQDEISGARCFRLTLRKGARRGYFTSSINLRVSNDPTPYDVPVSAHVCGPILFAPETLYLPVPPHARRDCSILVWRTDGRPLGKLIRYEVPQGITIKEAEADSTQRKLLRIAANAHWDPATRSRLRLRFHGVDEDVVIELRAREIPD